MIFATVLFLFFAFTKKSRISGYCR